MAEMQYCLLATWPDQSLLGGAWLILGVAWLCWEELGLFFGGAWALFLGGALPVALYLPFIINNPQKGNGPHLEVVQD